MRVVCISDTHGRHAELSVPAGDLLVHAGDFTRGGTLAEIAGFARWLAGLPHRHKVVVAGNHEFALETDPDAAQALLADVHYLRDRSVRLLGVEIYGSPWQPRFHDWAFNLDRGPALRAQWSKIPARTELLVTHGPMAGVGDRVASGERVGCADLRDEILQRIAPRLHICGHIHEDRGRFELGHTTSINASSLDARYQPYAQPAMIFDWH